MGFDLWLKHNPSPWSPAPAHPLAPQGLCSLFPLGDSQGWSGTVHPGGEEEDMFIHEVIAWMLHR